MNRAISPIIMTSISVNLFFTCTFLRSALEMTPNLLQSFTFWVKFGFFLFKVSALLIYASEVFEVSKGSLEVFNAIPMKGWCLEAKRFRYEIINDEVGLNCMNFFLLTREFMVELAAFIISFELV
jgi:hypothetical protein